MHIRVLAIGSRQPEWVSDACQRYSARLPKSWRFEIVEIAAGHGAAADKAAQGQRVLDRLRPAERLVALDERGRSLSSLELSSALSGWLAEGRDIAFVIGGADGLDKTVLQRADTTLSLSAMTLAHGLARTVLLEQLYRAHTLLSGHPYHRA